MREIAYRREDLRERLATIRVLRSRNLPEEMINRELSIARAILVTYRAAQVARRSGRAERSASSQVFLDTTARL